MNQKVSIIIRTKNEEKWIGSCLDAVFRQSYKNFEVVLVDNRSDDRTVEKAKKYPITLVEITEFLPGKAINDGIRASTGDILVILSGHCIPVNEAWLGSLVQDLTDEQVAGVYGRQEPLSFTSALDKRDLAITFGLDKKVQHKDSFFHNANSALRRDIWERFQFDETVTNIEDRVWGAEVIAAGLKILYEPEASVYHHHGIHHGRNIQRAENIVRIMEDLHGSHRDFDTLALENSRIVAIVPIRGETLHAGSHNLLPYTLKYLKSSKYISEVVVATDREKTAELAVEHGATVPFLRPSSLSEDYIDLSEVLSYSLRKIEETSGIVDLVVVAEETHPFRPVSMMDDMIVSLMQDGLDSIIAAYPEPRKLWVSDENGINQIGEEGFMPRKLKKDQVHVGLVGLGCVTHPTHIRAGTIFGSKLGLHPIHGSISAISIRDSESLEDCIPLLENWSQE